MEEELIVEQGEAEADCEQIEEVVIASQDYQDLQHQLSKNENKIHQISTYLLVQQLGFTCHGRTALISVIC